MRLQLFYVCHYKIQSMVHRVYNLRLLEQSSYLPPWMHRREKKKTFLFLNIKVRLPYPSQSHGNQATASLSQHHTSPDYQELEASSRGQAAEPQLRRKDALPRLPPCGTAKSNLQGWNPLPLVQTHLRVPDQCSLIDSACVGGLGAVYTECQGSVRRMSVRAGVVERAVSDVGGGRGRGPGKSATSGIRKHHPPCRI